MATHAKIALHLTQASLGPDCKIKGTSSRQCNEELCPLRLPRQRGARQKIQGKWLPSFIEQLPAPRFGLGFPFVCFVCWWWGGGGSLTGFWLVGGGGGGGGVPPWVLWVGWGSLLGFPLWLKNCGVENMPPFSGGSWVNDPQAAHLLLFMSGSTRTNFLLRTVRPDHHRPDASSTNACCAVGT